MVMVEEKLNKKRRNKKMAIIRMIVPRTQHCQLMLDCDPEKAVEVYNYLYQNQPEKEPYPYIFQHMQKPDAEPLLGYASWAMDQLARVGITFALRERGLERMWGAENLFKFFPPKAEKIDYEVRYSRKGGVLKKTKLCK